MRKDPKTVVTCSLFIALFLMFSIDLCQAQWQVFGTPPFEFYRFDGEFVPGPDGQAWANKVYFMGGRTLSSLESPDIWRFDPVTGTYADTGHDMIEDVGNYTANLILDDGTGRGPAIYVIGGLDRDGASAPIGTVQRYYPQTGEVEALPEADNWTVTVGGNLVFPGGTAVVNGIIYVFGGMESITDPYFYDGTWAFDPKQPSGSRWANLGVTLNPARAYIQVAVVGTRIYAMGGDSSFAGGSELDSTTAVEVLDTTNIGAGWTDLAPMPVASGEGCGFGFGNLTDIASGFRNKLYVVGGGDWPSNTIEVMEYDIMSNTWNQAFHDLNQPRRNCAAAFVPTTTPSSTDGLPGMWVFGGFLTSDVPPYADAEFYPLSEASATSIPALNEWGMIIFMGLAILGAVYYLRRKKHASTI
jgi:hypothetical protein